MNLAHQKLFKAVDSSTKYFYFPRKQESYMTNFYLIENDFKMLLISLPLLTLLFLTAVNSMRHWSAKLKGFTRWTHLGGIMLVTVLLQKES